MNVTAIRGDGQPDKVRDEFRKLQAALSIVLEGQAVIARITRAKYDALIEQGFSPAQALELCK